MDEIICLRIRYQQRTGKEIDALTPYVSKRKGTQLLKYATLRISVYCGSSVESCLHRATQAILNADGLSVPPAEREEEGFCIVAPVLVRLLTAL